jgi:cell division septum initiation protein DivIVA
MRFWLVIVLIAAPLVGFAQVADRRAELAQRIASHGVASADREAMRAAMTDEAARPIFKALRKLPEWGPEHPDWVKHYAEFQAGYRALMEKYPFDVEQELKAALLRDMSEAELEAVAAFQSNPRVQNMIERLRVVGLDIGSALRISGLAMYPQLYSQAEKDEMQRKLDGLKDRAREIAALKAEMQEVSKAMQEPAMRKYETILQDTLALSVNRAKSDTAFRNEMLRFLQSWRARLP